MTNRQKEDNLMKQLKDPNETHSTEISMLIDDKTKRHKNVWLMGDWHLWLRDEKGKSACHKRSDFDTIIKNINQKVHQNDLLIYMGDLVDGEFTDKESLKQVVQTLPGTKILVKGNNDVFDMTFYKSCGFLYVVNSFVWKNVLFTHIPVENDKEINVHAHLHNYHRYRIPYKNHIDVAYLNGRKVPVELMSVIKAQPMYSKIIIEEPKYFKEGYQPIQDTFTSIMTSNFIPDPYEAW